jgi:hypothetical protein
MEISLHHKKLLKDPVDSLKAPLRVKLLAWLATFLILLGGVYLSYMNSDWMWFARFGALIVIVSLCIEASGLVQSYINRIVNLSADLSEEIVKMQVPSRPHMYGLSGGESEDQINQIANKEHKHRITHLKLKLEKSISADIRKTEFSIGCVGTIVWGFGDLLGKFCV